jgi:endoglucanase
MRSRLWILPALAVVVAALLAGGPAPAQARATAGAVTVEVPPPVGSPADLCQVSYVLVGQWPTGFVATVIVRNVSTVPVRWTVTITYPGGEITQAWSVVGTRVGDTWTFTRPPWLGSLDILPPGATAQFGLAGTGSGLPARVTVTCVPVSW